jgi:dolichyl-phosphate beta-glucosyltransferase
MEMNEKLTIVIPAFNEAKKIEATVDEVTSFISGRGYSYELIIVDDGSKDDTLDIIKRYKALNSNGSIKILENNPNRGKGFVVRKGIIEATGDYILFMDADNSTRIFEIERMLPSFKEGFDIAIGSRRLKNVPGNIVISQPSSRHILGEIYIYISRLFFKISVRDYNCGFKMFKNNVAKMIFSRQRMDDWSFDLETLFLAEKYKLKIKEVPVNWKHYEGSKVRPVLDGIKSFISIFRIKANDIFGKYD